MSTSQESFRDVLFHEQMENGIQRILNKLDQIIRQNEHIIFSQHRLEAQNGRMVSQNQQMLGNWKGQKQTHLRRLNMQEYPQIMIERHRILRRHFIWKTKDKIALLKNNKT